VSLNPIPKPSKIIALWNNYFDLAEKQGNAIPAEPLYFVKTPNSYSGHEDLVKCPPTSIYGRTFFEGELGIVIGKRCSQVSLRGNPLLH
jgi:2-keto-4-pentenoate hydratase/2-oxohepta-3-ene-1,7-dioic acid hydratase in catechol pathway